MGKYFITGRQGSGKTSVIKALQARGVTAYNTDDMPGVTRLQNKETGEVVEWPESGVVDWAKYAWVWQRPEIEKLLASDEVVFLGAIVSEQGQYYPLFDKVFVLTIDAATLRERLEKHEHESHHKPGEIDRILSDHELKQQRLIKEGVETVDATRSTDEIVDDILRRVGLQGK